MNARNGVTQTTYHAQKGVWMSSGNTKHKASADTSNRVNQAGPLLGSNPNQLAGANQVNQTIDSGTMHNSKSRVNKQLQLFLRNDPHCLSGL